MSAPRWFDQAEAEIERQYAAGWMTAAEVQAALRDLHAELREAADEEAERARDAYMGGW